MSKKKKEPTKSTYWVEIQKTATLYGTYLVSATARLERTKIGLIKNSAQDIADKIRNFETREDGNDEEVSYIESVDNICSIPSLDKCPHCHKILNADIFDLGEVDD